MPMTDVISQKTARCPHCGGIGWYSYGSHPKDRYDCDICKKTGRVTVDKMKEFVGAFNATRLSGDRLKEHGWYLDGP